VTTQLQYWNGKTWVFNDSDSCVTSIPASAIALSGYLDSKGASTTGWSTSAAAAVLSGGTGSFTVAAPSPTGATGSVDVAVNLGSTSADQSCLSAHPATTGANLAFLRANNGSCATSADRDPSARVSFGVHSPETKKMIHVRDLF